MSDTTNDRRDFFISFNRADRAWATWIAWVLEEAGYSVFFQDWDFRGNFIEQMHQATAHSARALVVLSDSYLRSEFARSEAWVARSGDAVGSQDRVLTVKIGPTGELGLFTQFAHLDLSRETAADAKRLLCESAKKSLDPAARRTKLSTHPHFPGQVAPKTAFPAPAAGPVIALDNLLSPSVDLNYLIDQSSQALPSDLLIGSTGEDPVSSLMRSQKNDNLLFDVFLSHSHSDAGEVERLTTMLEDLHGIKVWLDKWKLVPGGEWQQEIVKALDHSKTCAVCIRQSHLTGWFNQEIQLSLNMQTRNISFRVIPVLLPGGDRGIVDNFLELRTWVEFTDGLDDADALHRLVCGINGQPPGRLDSKYSSSKNEPHISQLHHIKRLLAGELIDVEIAREYQRRILDQILWK